MSEQQLKDFGARAETLVDVPDFAELDSKGAHLQTRRRLGWPRGSPWCWRWRVPA